MKRHTRTVRSANRQSTGYSARYVEALRVRNRIYLALIVAKALAICVLSMYSGGCP